MLRIEPKIGLVGGYQPKIRPATTTAGAGASGAAAGQTSLSRELDDPQYRVGGDIEFRSVNFKYAGMRKKMLKDVSFKVKAGSFVGICGERGAGKTTMFKLLLRLYDPESGEVLVGGRNIKEYNPVWLRSQIGLSKQDPAIFSG